MAATKPALASGGITHCRLRWGLSAFFLSPSDRVVAGLLDDVQFDNFLLEQAQAPTGEPLGSRRAGQSDQFRLRGPVENPRPGGVRIVLAAQRRLEPFLDEPTPGTTDRVDTRIQCHRDRALAPPFARLRHVRLQEDPRLRQRTAPDACPNRSSPPADRAPRRSTSPHT